MAIFGFRVKQGQAGENYIMKIIKVYTPDKT
jgi:hypothetical protein